MCSGLAAAPAAADCRAGRASPPQGSCRPANTRRSIQSAWSKDLRTCTILRRTLAVCEAEFQGLCFKLRPIAQHGQYGTATASRYADLRRITRLIAIGEIGVARLKACENPPKRNYAI